jgi:hypothetical protein
LTTVRVGERAPLHQIWLRVPVVDAHERERSAVKPMSVDNVRDDELLTTFWGSIILRRHRLIPVIAWAEAEGQNRELARSAAKVHPVE